MYSYMKALERDSCPQSERNCYSLCACHILVILDAVAHLFTSENLQQRNAHLNAMFHSFSLDRVPTFLLLRRHVRMLLPPPSLLHECLLPPPRLQDLASEAKRKSRVAG